MTCNGESLAGRREWEKALTGWARRTEYFERKFEQSGTPDPLHSSDTLGYKVSAFGKKWGGYTAVAAFCSQDEREEAFDTGVAKFCQSMERISRLRLKHGLSGR